MVMMTVKEIMSSPVNSIEFDKTAKEAAEYMSKTRRGFLVVTSKGRPVGVLSDSDMIKITAKDLKASAVKVKDIMSKPVVTVSPDDDVETALNKMKKSNIHRIPVLKGGKLVGIVSLTDLARKAPATKMATPQLQIKTPKTTTAESTTSELLELRLKMKEGTPEIREEFTSGICENCGNYSENLKLINDEWLCDDCKEDLEKESEE